MTNEEAIEELKRDIHNAKVTHHLSEHYEMAIKALEQEPCDAIIRAEALKNLALTNGKDDVYRMINSLPSVQPTTKENLAVPMSVIEDIKAEIKEESKFCPFTEGLERALEIIDKHTAESEDKE